MLVINTKFWFFLLLRGLESPLQPTKHHFGILRNRPINDPREIFFKRQLFCQHDPVCRTFRGHFLQKWRLHKKLVWIICQSYSQAFRIGATLICLFEKVTYSCCLKICSFSLIFGSQERCLNLRGFQTFPGGFKDHKVYT